MRFFPALFVVASVVLVYFLGRRWFSERAACFSAALLSVSGLAVQFSREARPYSALMLAALLIAWAVDAVLRALIPDSKSSRGAWIVFATVTMLCELSAITAALVHPLSALVFAAAMLGVLLAW